MALCSSNLLNKVSAAVSIMIMKYSMILLSLLLLLLLESKMVSSSFSSKFSGGRDSKQRRVGCSENSANEQREEKRGADCLLK